MEQKDKEAKGQMKKKETMDTESSKDVIEKKRDEAEPRIKRKTPSCSGACFPK